MNFLEYTESELRMAFDDSCKFSSFDEFKEYVKEKRKLEKIDVESISLMVEESRKDGSKIVIIGCSRGVQLPINDKDRGIKMIEDRLKMNDIISESILEIGKYDYAPPKIDYNPKPFYEILNPKSQSRYAKKHRK